MLKSEHVSLVKSNELPFIEALRQRDGQRGQCVVLWFEYLEVHLMDLFV